MFNPATKLIECHRLAYGQNLGENHWDASIGKDSATLKIDQTQVDAGTAVAQALNAQTQLMQQLVPLITALATKPGG